VLKVKRIYEEITKHCKKILSQYSPAKTEENKGAPEIRITDVPFM
jgi:hypothetical protein